MVVRAMPRSGTCDRASDQARGGDAFAALRAQKLDRTVQIQAPHFTAGVVIHKGQVVDAAPIVKYMIGWDLQRVLDYVKQKRWGT